MVMVSRLHHSPRNIRHGTRLSAGLPRREGTLASAAIDDVAEVALKAVMMDERQFWLAPEHQVRLRAGLPDNAQTGAG